MAHLTADFGVVLIERLTCYAVVERAHCPLPMAFLAVPVQLHKGHRGVATPATEVAMKAIQRPARACVIERPGLGPVRDPVATFTPLLASARQVHISLVASEAGTMVLDEGARP